MVHNVPQPVIEQFMVENLGSEYEIRKGHSFVFCESVSYTPSRSNLFLTPLQKDETVTTTIEDRSTGKTYTLRSRFMVGCDGAKSRVRESLGIERDGEHTCKYPVMPSMCAS